MWYSLNCFSMFCFCLTIDPILMWIFASVILFSLLKVLAVKQLFFVCFWSEVGSLLVFLGLISGNSVFLLLGVVMELFLVPQVFLAVLPVFSQSFLVPVVYFLTVGKTAWLFFFLSFIEEEFFLPVMFLGCWCFCMFFGSKEIFSVLIFSSMVFPVWVFCLGFSDLVFAFYSIVFYVFYTFLCCVCFSSSSLYASVLLWSPLHFGWLIKVSLMGSSFGLVFLLLVLQVFVVFSVCSLVLQEFLSGEVSPVVLWFFVFFFGILLVV